jgi:membrane protease YdiL (CAAX protease family)
MERRFFEKKGITWAFAVVSLIFGFMFLDSGFTGNVIVNKPGAINLVSIIGLLLITCSTVLITYSIKKK